MKQARQRWRTGQHRHAEYGAIGFPSRGETEKIMAALCGALFPLRLGPQFVRIENEDAFVAETLDTALRKLNGQVRLELAYAGQQDADAARIVGAFAAALPDLRGLLDGDVDAAYAGDPAARSVDEILLCEQAITVPKLLPRWSDSAGRRRVRIGRAFSRDFAAIAFKSLHPDR